jgi:hypothetical protein
VSHHVDVTSRDNFLNPTVINSTLLGIEPQGCEQSRRPVVEGAMSPVAVLETSPSA